MKFKVNEKRIKILVRDNYTCQYCGFTTSNTELLFVDHVIPKSKGGKNNQENLKTSCLRCNNIKKDNELFDFLKIIKEKQQHHLAELKYYNSIIGNLGILII